MSKANPLIVLSDTERERFADHCEQRAREVDALGRRAAKDGKGRAELMELSLVMEAYIVVHRDLMKGKSG